MRPDRILPLIIAVALFMEHMDATVIATSLPAIAADIGTNPLALKLAITSYLLSLAIFIPASGWSADRFGARTVFRAALGVFIIGSIGCALSSSLTDFVIARIVQGMGGAMMTPVGRLIMVRSIPRRELINAMAWVAVPALIGPLLGPPVGGFITTYASWHWIFIINVPIGLVGILLASRYIENLRAENHERFDVTGMVLAGLGIAGIAFGLSVLGLNFLPWSVVAGLVGGGAIFMAAYVVHARRTPTPALDLTLFRQPTFRASVTGGFVFRIGIGALPFLLPLMLQVGFGMSPFQSGLITFATAIGAMTMKVAAVTILRRFRLPHRPRRQRYHQLGIFGSLRDLHANHSGRGYGRPVIGRRFLPLAPVHLHQHNCLCRGGNRPGEPGHVVGQRRSTTLDLGRRSAWRPRRGNDGRIQRSRRPGSAGLSPGLSGGSGDFGAVGDHICTAFARCRRGASQPGSCANRSPQSAS